MDNHSVIWVKSAKKDLNDIIDFIAQDKEAAAKNIYFKLKNKAESLVIMPQKGRIVPELKIAGIEIYRELLENPWRIIYKIQGAEIIILAVIDERRDFEDIIFDKLIEK